MLGPSAYLLLGERLSRCRHDTGSSWEIVMSTASGNGGPDPSSVTVFRSPSVSLLGTAPLPQIAHQISRQLPILATI